MQRPTHHYPFLQKQDFSNQLHTRKNHTYQYVHSLSIPTFFPDYIRIDLETSICDLEFSEVHTFEKARFIGLERC